MFGGKKGRFSSAFTGKGIQWASCCFGPQHFKEHKFIRGKQQTLAAMMLQTDREQKLPTKKEQMAAAVKCTVRMVKNQPLLAKVMQS